MLYDKSQGIEILSQQKENKQTLKRKRKIKIKARLEGSLSGRAHMYPWVSCCTIKEEKKKIGRFQTDNLIHPEGTKQGGGKKNLSPKWIEGNNDED